MGKIAGNKTWTDTIRTNVHCTKDGRGEVEERGGGREVPGPLKTEEAEEKRGGEGGTVLSLARHSARPLFSQPAF